MDNSGIGKFMTPLNPNREQSQLGKESRRLYKEGDNSVRLTLARVVKVNYKYNTVDVITIQGQDNFMRNPSDNGKYSARLPISFGGRTSNGDVYGKTTLVTEGSMVLIGFVEGNKDRPIVLNIYGDVDNQSQLTRTTFTGGEDSHEAIQKELWNIFSLYPSMTYKNIDGRGNVEETFSGRSFMYITGDDSDNNYVQDAGFDYMDLPSSRYADGELIEPKSPNSPTVLYVHQGVYDKHRVTFFIKGDGTVRVGSRHLDGEGVTFQEMNTDGSFAITQKRDTTNPEESSEVFSEFRITPEGSINLSSRKNKMEITDRGVFVNGKPIEGSFSQQIKDLEDAILESYIFMGILEDEIVLKAGKVELDDLTNQVVEQKAELTVAFDAIKTKVSRREFAAMQGGTANMITRTAFIDKPDLVFGDGYARIEYLPSPNDDILEEGYREIRVYKERTNDIGVQVMLGNYDPFEVAIDEEYTFSFDARFYNISSINVLTIAGRDKEGDYREIVLPAIPVDSGEELEDDWRRYQVSFKADIGIVKEGVVILGIAPPELDLMDYFDLRTPQLEKGKPATEWGMAYLDYEVMRQFETGFEQLSDSITLTAKAFEKQLGETNDRVDENGKAIDDFDIRLQDAEFKVTPEEITKTLTESKIYIDDKNAQIKYTDDAKAEAEREAKEYADNMKEGIDTDIGNISSGLSDLDEYVDGAFKDGIIEESEAQTIASLINLIETDKSVIDKRYEDIYGNTDLIGVPKTNLLSSKEAFDTAHIALLNAINEAIADSKTTIAEKANVDAKFADYKVKITDLTDALEKAVDAIASKKSGDAEKNAKKYADEMKVAIDSEILQITEGLDNLDGYIDGAFKDGIIEEAEARSIESLINILESDKLVIDRRYNDIYASVDLVGEPKTTLLSRKTAFDTAHTNLINSINTAIADGKTTVAEKADVDAKFATYKVAIVNLTEALEKAVDSIASKQIADAEERANDHANKVSDKAKQDAIDQVTNSDDYSEVEFNRGKADVDAIVISAALPYLRGSHVDMWVAEGANLIVGNKLLANTSTNSTTGELQATNRAQATEYYTDVGEHTQITVSRKPDTVNNNNNTTEFDFFRVVSYNASKVFISSQQLNRPVTPPQTINLPVGTKYVRFSSSREDLVKLKVEFGAGTGDYTLSPEEEWATNGNRVQGVHNPTLTIGASEQVIRDTFYGTSGVYDELYWDVIGDAIKVKRWEDVLLSRDNLEESNPRQSKYIDFNILAWDNFPGTLATTNQALQSGVTLIGHEGEIFEFKLGSGGSAGAPYNFQVNANGNTYMNIPYASTGTAQTYSMTQDEITAYFDGWRMCNGTYGGLYTTGKKTWHPIGDTDLSRAVSPDNGIPPINTAPTINEKKINRYQFIYQLEEPQEEVVDYIGLAQLQVGPNALTLQSTNNVPIPWSKVRYANTLGSSARMLLEQITPIRVVLNDVKERTTAESIVTTMTQSVEYLSMMDGKADLSALNGFTSKEELEEWLDKIDDKIFEEIAGIDFEPYVTQRELEETAKSWEQRFSATGGMNIVKNSIGFGGLDFWKLSPVNSAGVSTISNHELDVLGFGSGFYFNKPTGSSTYIDQYIPVVANVPYTLSWYVKKSPGATDAGIRMQVLNEAGNTIISQKLYDSGHVTDGYEHGSFTISTKESRVLLRIRGYANTISTVTGLMLNIGTTALQWSLATGELYNTFTRIDMGGIRVSQLDSERRETGFTSITPEEFAGYYDDSGDGNFEKVFHLNKDETETKKLRAREEITMGGLRITKVSSPERSGWAFIPIKET